jgi:hypothetical protein
MTDLEAIVKSLGFKMVINHVGLETEQNWTYDLWTYTITFEGRNYSGKYKCGIGHRKMRKMVQSNGYGKGYYNSLTHTSAKDELAAAHLNWSDPTPPSVSDILSSLACDARCSETSFDDWCSELGYDTDSRKAFDMYQACVKTRSDMVRLMGYKLLDEIGNADH